MFKDNNSLGIVKDRIAIYAEYHKDKHELVYTIYPVLDHFQKDYIVFVQIITRQALNVSLEEAEEMMKDRIDSVEYNIEIFDLPEGVDFRYYLDWNNEKKAITVDGKVIDGNKVYTESVDINVSYKDYVRTFNFIITGNEGSEPVFTCNGEIVKSKLFDK